MSLISWILIALISVPSFAQNVAISEPSEQNTLSDFFPAEPVSDSDIADLRAENDPNNYFTIDEGNRPKNSERFSTPTEILGESLMQAVEVAPRLLLTQWVRHNSSPQKPPVKYDRVLHFGTWINDPNDDTCYNTRAKVLIRDSKSPVGYKPHNKCAVETGNWADPYTGKTLRTTDLIHIDHVVPLKHAYQTGAWKWNYQTRCLYANFMANPYHLLSVNKHQNMSKGDRSPEDYMPPDSHAQCSYLQIWLRIKLTWKLVMFPGEADAIRELMAANRCNTDNFAMTRSDLAAQRRAMSEQLPLCREKPRHLANDVN